MDSKKVDAALEDSSAAADDGDIEMMEDEEDGNVDDLEDEEECDDTSAKESSASDRGSSLTPTTAAAGSNGTTPKMSYPIEDYTPPSLSSTHDLSRSFAWSTLLDEPDFTAAPVALFQHAPMSDCWENIIVGMKVEVENSDCESYPGVFSNAFWVATVLRIGGYNALLRYEGFGQDGGRDFWMNLCSDKVHPVGWCATKGKPLIPPKTIQSKYPDWKDFLVKRLTGARTLPSNFYGKVWESVGSLFRPGMKLEVVDKMRICQVRVATIQEITGRRLYLQYDNVDHDDKGFWCHEESPLIHPVGWARRVGHQVVASPEYFERCSMESFGREDCTADMFPEYRQPPGKFEVGMKLEAVDPLNLATICVATIMKVLRFGYVMIRIDGYEEDATGSDWFCYHASSALIFPPGFCEKNRIKLKPPSGYEEGDFSWFDYLKITQSTAAPTSLFPREEVKHGFKVGMKVECADQMDPRLICVSAVTRIIGRLLKVHFDGWEEEYDQWMDCESVDMYPVGWAELVGHKLEGPRVAMPPANKAKKKTVAKPKAAKKRPANSSPAGAPATAAAAAAASATVPTAATVSAGKKQAKKPSPTAEAAATTTEKPESAKPAGNSAAAGGGGRRALAGSDGGGRALIGGDGGGRAPIGGDAAAGFARAGNSNAAAGFPRAGNSNAAAGFARAGNSNAALVKTSSDAAAAAADLTKRAAQPMMTSPSLDLKVIPRLVDSTGQSIAHRGGGRDAGLDPQTWNVDEVAQFLQINECASIADAFAEGLIDGGRFLSLRKEDVMKLVHNKIGPCLKVENLLSLLKARMNPAQARLDMMMMKKKP